MLQKILLGFLLLIAGVYFYIHSGPKLPKEIDRIVDEVLSEELPQLITGKTGYVKSDGIQIWYESQMPQSRGFQGNPKGVVLLVMGQGVSAVGGSSELYETLLKAGYQVIRTDHRGLGMSDWLPNWNKKNAYNLSDMAADNIAVLNALGVQKTHLFGISMGGVISQTIAINHPERVNSLISMMSSADAYDPDLPPPPAYITRDMIKLFIRFGLISSEENTMKLMVGICDLLKGEGDNEIDIKQISQSTLYEFRHRNGINHKASEQHGVAVEKTGPLYHGLSTLTIPALIIHGEEDPLLDIAHAKKYAALIPGAKTLWVEGMGHEISQRYAPIWISKAIEFLDEYDQK